MQRLFLMQGSLAFIKYLGTITIFLHSFLQERNVAIKEKNEAWIELSVTKGELIQTNQQLLEVDFEMFDKQKINHVYH